MLEYWNELAMCIGGISAFLAGRKTAKIQNLGGELDNLSKYQSMYDKFVEQYQREFKALGDKITDLELRNSIIIEESQSWQNRFSTLQKLYDKLKSEFDEYKKNHK